jgi:hypothetical protein
MLSVDFLRRQRRLHRAVGRTLIVERNLIHQMDCPMNVNLQLLLELYVYRVPDIVSNFFFSNCHLLLLPMLTTFCVY